MSPTGDGDRDGDEGAATGERPLGASMPLGPVRPGQVLLGIGVVFVLGVLLGFVLGRTV